jgi:autotransporter translocation and assembly factor TamB
MKRNRSWSLKKFLLVGLPTALVLLLAFSVYWLLHTSSGAAWVWSQVEDLAAGTVRSSHVDGDLASGFVIKGLEYRSDEFDLSVAHAEIVAGPDWWPLSIQVQTLALRDVDIVIHSRAEKAVGASPEMDIHSALAALKLQIPLKVQNAELTNISLQQGDEPQRTMIESLEFQASLHKRLVVDRLDIVAAGIDARLDGHLLLEPPFELRAVVEGRYEMTAETGTARLILPFRLECSGDPDNVQFGLVSHETGMQVGDELLQLSISGSGSASGIQISSASLTGPGTDLLININADIDAAANKVNAQLDWIGFSWPLADSTADLSSPSGRLSVNGSIDQWTGSGEAELQLGDYPQGRFEISGAGGRTSARLTIPNGAILGGSLSGEARADWTDDLAWDATIRTRGINPEPLLPGWPGSHARPGTWYSGQCPWQFYHQRRQCGLQGCGYQHGPGQVAVAWQYRRARRCFDDIQR